MPLAPRHDPAPQQLLGLRRPARAVALEHREHARAKVVDLLAQFRDLFRFGGLIEDRLVFGQRIVHLAQRLFEQAPVFRGGLRFRVEESITHVDRAEQDLRAHRGQQLLRMHVAAVDGVRLLAHVGDAARQQVAATSHSTSVSPKPSRSAARVVRPSRRAGALTLRSYCAPPALVGRQPPPCFRVGKYRNCPMGCLAAAR